MYQTLSRRGSFGADIELLVNVLAYADGEYDVPTMAQVFNVPESQVEEAGSILLDAGLLIIDSKNTTRRSSIAETAGSWRKSAMPRGSKEPELAIPEADVNTWQK